MVRGNRDYSGRVSDLARRVGCEPATVARYEALGLLAPVVPRATGGLAAADRDERRVRLILLLRSVGFSVEEIRELLAARDTAVNAAEGARLIQQAIAVARERVEERRRKLLALDRDLLRADALLECCTSCSHVTDRKACGDCRIMGWDVPATIDALFLD